MNSRCPMAVATMVLLACTGAAAASGAPAHARIVAVQAGDVACYVTVQAAGETQVLLADFSLCDEPDALVGYSANLRYRRENVAADDCAGDPECPRSQSVDLLVAAEALTRPSATADGDAQQQAASLCGEGERVIFECAVGVKQVAACAMPTPAALQYRFGRADGSALELRLPEPALPPAEAASGAVLSFSRGGGAWLRFRRGDHAYVLYTAIGNWGAQGETVERAGVVVERRGQSIAVLPCVGEPISELGADWFDSVGIGAADDEYFDLPE